MGKSLKISGSCSIRFLAKPGFWFVSFLMGSGPLPISNINVRVNLYFDRKCNFDHAAGIKKYIFLDVSAPELTE